VRVDKQILKIFGDLEKGREEGRGGSYRYAYVNV
jgi:hypothetical protein